MTALLLAVALAIPAAGQFVLTRHQDLDFDRPEAWAMAWFSAVTVPSALDAAEPLEPWAVELAFEAGWVPTLSEEQRTVGFIGGKTEDLNRTSVFGRPRVAVGLPAKLTATVGWVPPAELDGIKPNVWSLSLGRPIWQGERGRLAARVIAERGTLDGDLSCPAAVAAGSAPSTVDCDEPSRDELQVELVGVEMHAAVRSARWPRLSPYAAVGASRLDAELQIDARYNQAIIDRSSLATEGTLWWGTLGLSLDAGARSRLAGEIFYAPLEVRGRAGKGREDDGLLNARVLLGYRLR